MTKAVAFIGLGIMGAHMARHLADKGYTIAVYNRSRGKAEAWLKERGGKGGHRIAESPQDAASGATLVFACVGADPDVRAVTTGFEGAFSGMEKGAVFVDHTTASAELARELAHEAEKRGFGFLDAPVSGGEAGARTGQLTVMVGGKPADFEKAEAAIGAYAKMASRLGPAGSGQLAKMVNQICLAGTIEGLAEAIHFGTKAGLDMAKVIAVISKGAAQSWQMDNRAKTMMAGEFDFGFAVDWMRKDFGMVLAEAKRLGIELPVAALVDGFYEDVQNMGGARQDTSSLIRRYRR
jgi:3-hydroxyisobutyrate dehydrogenase